MVEASSAPRRVSMAYILGFSNKPFKDGGPPAPPQLPPPRHPSAFKQMVTTPGGVIEWAASDGRRGRLIGPGKPRLAAANLAQVPEGKYSVKAAPKKDAAQDEGGIAMFGLFEDGPAAPAQSEAAKDNKPADSNWTEEQDKKLMDMKGEEKSWNDIAGEVGKNVGQCKERFKNIKPKAWQPNNTKKGNKQKGGKDQNQEENKDGQKKDDNVDQGFNPDENAWSRGNNDIWDAKNAAAGGFQDKSGGNNNWSNSNENGEKQDGSNNGCGGGSWDGGADNNGGDNQGTDNNNEGDDGGGDSSGIGTKTGRDSGGGGGGGGEGDAWTSGNNVTWDNSGDNTATEDKTSKKSPSNKGSSSKDTKQPFNKINSLSRSKSGSTRESDQPSASAPTEYELKPDSTFSANDLRLMAKILQQDCQMVWNRVSWRFKDKTGRNLHPDVFEKKITGRVEDRGSERGRR